MIQSAQRSKSKTEQLTAGDTLIRGKNIKENKGMIHSKFRAVDTSG